MKKSNLCSTESTDQKCLQNLKNVIIKQDTLIHIKGGKSDLDPENVKDNIENNDGLDDEEDSSSR